MRRVRQPRRKVGQRPTPPKRATIMQRALWYKRRQRRDPSTVVPFGIREVIKKGLGS